MRIDEFTLERYGAFEQLSVEFDGPGLTVVYGANEAGKSTFLSALGDFLFRIPERSPRVERFGSDVTRICATLTATDGRRLVLKRRYGRGRTLIGVDGAPCDDALLSSLLGSTTRDRFETLFGLNHESLRRGGDALLRADGDIGRLIVEAGGGLRTLMSRLDAIDAEIDGLFAPRAKEGRAFYDALSAFKVADKAGREATLTREAYEKDRKAQEAAATITAAIRKSRRELGEALSRLRRAERAVPALRQLDEVEASLAAYGEVSAFADNFAERCEKALSNRDAASAELEKSRLRHAEVANRLQAMIVDDGLVAAEVEARDIGQRATIVAQAREGLANRLKELSDAGAQLAGLRARLALPPETDLAPLMPPPAILETIRELASEAGTRKPGLENARETVCSLDTAVFDAEKKVADLAARGRDVPFAMTGAMFASLPADWASAEQKITEARAVAGLAAARAAAVGFHDVAALRALVLPPDDQVRAEIGTRSEIASEQIRQVAARAAAEVQRDTAAAEIEKLRQAGEIATLDAVLAARGQRERAWAPIRAAYLAGHLDRSEAERSADVAALESGFADADRLADRRITEAERTAGLAEAQRRMFEGSAAVKAALDAEQHLVGELARRTEGLKLAFPEAFDRRSDLGAVLALSVERAIILGKADAGETLRHEGERSLGQLTASVRLLEVAEAKAGLTPPLGSGLSARVQAIAEAIGVHEREHDRFQREGRDLVGLRHKLVDARRMLAALAREQQQWANSWARIMPSLGLAEDAPPAAGATLANLWAAARGELRSIAQTRRRLDRMNEDELNLSGRVKLLAERLGLAIPDDPVAAGAMLEDRWRKNDAVRLRRETLAPELEAANAAVAAHETAVTKTEAALIEIKTEAGAADEGALRTAAARHREWCGLRIEQARLASAARVAGDGLSLPTLRQEAAGQDLDSVRAEIADLTGQFDGLERDLEAAIRAEQQAATALLAHEKLSGAMLAVMKREMATVDMHTAIERYVELTLARHLLRQAVETVRREQQDPLVRAAGAMFARMTRGEFDGVAADLDAKGVPIVVGVRPGGRGTQSVSTMSDGTRDQLFLAFRLASLTNYSIAAEPLPFVADDILVHFDDDRGAASLDLLADFAQTTQVLLFTHHRAVRTTAERLAEDGRASIVELGP